MCSEKRLCPKCGKQRTPGDTECPNCGIIFAKHDDLLLKQEEARKRKEAERQEAIKQAALKSEEREKIRSKHRKVINESKNTFRKIFTPSPTKYAVVLLILILVIGGIYIHGKIKHKNDYISNLNNANSIMKLSTIKCVEMCEKYSEVWKDAIESKAGLDFNTEIFLQRTRFKSTGEIDKITDSKMEVENILQKLNSPPDLYPEAHRKIVQLYGIYSQLHSLAQSPSGTLISFNNKVNDLQSEYIKIINEIKVLMPND